MSRKTMIIVGNATPRNDLSDFVDGCDVIVRLNATGNLGSGRVGARTDILCLRSFGSVGQRFASGADALHPRAVESAAELWFVGEAGNWASAIIDRYDLGSKRHRFFSLARMRQVDRMLKGFGGARQGASLGCDSRHPGTGGSRVRTPAMAGHVPAEAVDAVSSCESGLAFTKAQADPGLVSTDDASLSRLTG